MSEKKKAEPFFIVKTLQNATDTLSRKAKTYGDKLYEIDYVKQAVDTGKDLVNTRYKRVADAWLVKGRDAKNDAIKRIEDLYNTGRNNVINNPLVERVEKSAKQLFSDLPNMLNLPERDFIEQLADTLDKIDKNVDAISDGKER